MDDKKDSWSRQDYDNYFRKTITLYVVLLVISFLYAIMSQGGYN